MNSLRRLLLTWLLPLYLAAALIAAACTYSMFGWAVDFFMDSQLRVFAESHAAGGLPERALPRLTRENVEKGDLIVQIWDRSGGLAATSWPELDLPRQNADGFHDFTVGGLQWRAYTLSSPDRTVQIVQCVDFRDSVIREQVWQNILPIALLIPLSAVILWFGVRMALRRLEDVAQAAARQDERNLSELPTQHVPCEIRPLVQAVNKMLSRLRAAFEGQRRFVQDAAHELRTPITAVSLQLENLKARIADPDLAEQVRQLEDGVARTRRLVDQLLRLARQESPERSAAPARLSLNALLAQSIAELLPIADRRAIDLGFAASVAVTIDGDADELRSLAHNVIDNALRYAPEGGVVDVALHADHGVATLEVIDDGPGVPPELIERVFDRFYRIEGAPGEGSGLGLAIARHAAERNAVQLELVNRSDCTGLIARMRFAAAHVERLEESASPTIAAELLTPPSTVAV